MGGYLVDPATLPQPSMRNALLTALVMDQNWNSLLTIIKKHRVSQNRIVHDCFGRDLFEVSLGIRNPAADIRDIVDIPTLITAIEPVIREAVAVAADAAPVFTPAETTNFEAFRISRGMMCLEPRTGAQLYRAIDGTLVAAAKDNDVLPNLSNLVTLTTVAAPGLAVIFADANLNRLYQLVEDSRRAHGRLLTDAIGRALYSASLGGRVQIVNMQDIADTTGLLNAVFGFFPENLRPVVPVCASCAALHH